MAEKDLRLMATISRASHLFIRSTNLTADLDSHVLLDRILLTDPLLRTLEATIDAADNNSTDAAISIIGPYGTGKSTTAVVAINFLRDTLPPRLHRMLVKRFGKKTYNLKPENILNIVGERQSLSVALDALSRRRFRNRRGLVENIRAELDRDSNDKLVLVIDEFGKFLEYSVDNPSDGDVYDLQNLAELSHRSGGRFIFITIRHQAVESYLRSSHDFQLKEWKKIQGRFLEIVHATRLEETLRILQQSLDEAGLARGIVPRRIIDTLVECNIFSDTKFYDTLSRVHPLHPYTTLILITAFKRLSQNERSLFSFLSTSERHGLSEFMSRNNGLSYDLAIFYDYLDHNFRHTMMESEASAMWSMIGNSLMLLRSKFGEIDIEGQHDQLTNMVKTIGMIDAFGGELGLRPTKIHLSSALSLESSDRKGRSVKELLKVLEDLSLVTYRRLTSSYHLWRGSDINIETEITQEVARIEGNVEYADLLHRFFHQAPVVARRLQIEIGTFRYARWKYASISMYPSREIHDGDGEIWCFVVPAEEREKTKESLKGKNIPNNVVTLLLRLTRPQERLIKTFAAVQNLLGNHQPLAMDRVARNELEEVSLQYKQRIERIFRQNRSSDTGLEFLDDNSVWVKCTWDMIGELVSERLSKVYSSTPSIHNELINTDTPSPSAMVGFKKLIIAMYQHQDEPNFAIPEKGAEYGIYLSILKRTGIHREKNEGTFTIMSPNVGDKRLDTVWKYLEARIIETGEKKKAVSFLELEELLKQPPFGLRTGLAKMLSLTCIASMLRELSVYEQGSFIPRIQIDTVERMIKLPRDFTVRYVMASDSVHQYLFKKISDILGSKQEDQVSLLDVVKPLVQFVNRLPDYTKNTKMLSDKTIAIRDVLRRSREPESLIHQEIPTALGLHEITSDTDNEILDKYVRLLEEAYLELRNAMDNLFDDCFNHFMKTWDIDVETVDDIRKMLVERFNPEVTSLMTEDGLISLANRILDNKLTDNLWFESITALLGGRPLENWTDRDKEMFISETKLKLLQFEELERFATIQRALKRERGKVHVDLVRKIEKFIENLDYPKQDKLLALARAYEKEINAIERKH